jgi:acyl carrier protein
LPGAALGGTQKELPQYVNRSLSVFKTVRPIEIVPHLAKTQTGKINAMNLRKPDGAALREKVVETIVRVLGEQYNPNQRDLELTSLQMLELIVALEDEFSIHISEDAPLARITSSVDAIVKYLRSVVPQS